MASKIEFTIDFNAKPEKYLQKEFPWISDWRVLSRNLDARGAGTGRVPKYVYRIEVIGEGERFCQNEESFPNLGELEQKPIIVGMGPAGFFCALRLAEYGIKSILLERGDSANLRMRKIARFWRYGNLDAQTNVCFGEGGAGLFSDGKLTTRIKSPHVGYVMKKFVEFGAPAETQWMANPHLGSNGIRKTIGAMTEGLKKAGVEFHYNSRVCKLIIEDGQMKGVELSSGKKFFSPNVVLATGHSARDIYGLLDENKVEMEAKDFAVGVRVEHPKAIIDRIQYGKYAGDPLLGAARYRLSYHDKKTGSGTYSFCMCPGGYVLSSGSESDGLVTNGMSNSSCNSRWSNSAIVVSVKSKMDFDASKIFAGVKFQREIERKAFQFSKEFAGGRSLPAQTIKSFLDGKKDAGGIKTSSPSGIFSCCMDDILPGFVTEHLKNAFLKFNQSMNGYISRDALVIAPETRTSSPVRILRDMESLESKTINGLYPCGEGAGLAGGITSAAVDGVKIAQSMIRKEKHF